VPLEIEVRGLTTAIKKAHRLPEVISKAERRAVNKSAQLVIAEVRQRLRSGTGRTTLSVRTGALRDSLNREPAKKFRKGWRARVGFRRGKVDKYAKTHEFGATIFAKKKFLAIPLSHTLTKSGARGERAGGGPEDFRGRGFWRKSPRNGKFYFYEINPGGRPIPIFIGLRNVRIPKRKPLRGSLAAKKKEIGRIMDDIIGRAIRGRASK